MRSKDIGVGGGQVWIVGKDGCAHQMVNGRWKRKAERALKKTKGGRSLRRITVDASGRPFVINKLNMIYQYDDARNNWIKLPGKAKDIGIN